MPTLPLFQLGKHLTSVVLTGQTVGTAGALTDSTSVATVTAYMKGLQQQLSPERQEINTLNTVRRNEVITSDGATLNLEVLKVNNASDPSPLRTLAFAFDYFKCVWIEGTGGSLKTATFYGVRGEYQDGFRDRGEQIASLELGPADIGSAQVAFA